MPDVGVCELRARASEIVRNVRERRARYTITYRGQAGGHPDPAGIARAGTVYRTRAAVRDAALEPSTASSETGVPA